MTFVALPAPGIEPWFSMLKMGFRKIIGTLSTQSFLTKIFMFNELKSVNKDLYLSCNFYLQRSQFCGDHECI